VVIEFDCGGEDSPHLFPDDWIFGGANGMDPGADPRFQVTTYWYLDADLEDVAVASHLRCDGDALEYFSQLQRLNPRYIFVKRPGKTKRAMMPYEYRADVDIIFDRPVKAECPPQWTAPLEEEQSGTSAA
jgi:hypothetical protein